MNSPMLSPVACPVCASLLPEKASFCAQCGTSLANCPICKALVPTGPTMCVRCGTKLSLPRKASQEPGPSASMLLPDATVFLRLQEEKQKLPVTGPASSPEDGIKEKEASEESMVLNRTGERFGNYRLTRLLGEGGFAEVYLGEHIHLGSQAAIKVLHGTLAQRDFHAFRSEARTLVQLVHPHIVRVLDFGIEGKIPFLVMDYAPLGTVRQRYPGGSRLPFSMVVSYVKQVAEALQFAHNKKIIHRDIKPENMLLGPREELLLSDFGIALIAQSSRYQHSQGMAGTITYMAPEQIQAHPQLASDQYALGIVAYEWLCGERPFQGTFTEIAVKHVLTPPPSLQKRNLMISKTVEQIVLKALAKDPQDRFVNVEAFANALAQAQ